MPATQATSKAEGKLGKITILKPGKIYLKIFDNLPYLRADFLIHVCSYAITKDVSFVLFDKRINAT